MWGRLPNGVVVQSAGRAPSGAVGSSGCGQVGLCDLPACCGASQSVGHTSSHAASPTGSSTWGTGGEGGALPSAPPCTAAVTLTLVSSFSNNPRGLLWEPGLHCCHHVWQEAQRLLWGLWMVGDRRGYLRDESGRGGGVSLALWGALSDAR